MKKKEEEKVLDPDSNTIDQFRVDAMLAHNIYRDKHDSVPLQHCKVLSDLAQKWADKISREDKLLHSIPEWRMQYNKVMLGENLVSTQDFKITGKGMSDMWYSESFKHDFNREDQKDTRSFTQMIWNESRQVGFGRAQSRTKNWYAVALYHPCGNIEGEFKENVRRIPFLPVEDEAIVKTDDDVINIDNINKSLYKNKNKKSDTPRKATAISNNESIRSTFTAKYLPVIYHKHDNTKKFTNNENYRSRSSDQTTKRNYLPSISSAASSKHESVLSKRNSLAGVSHFDIDDTGFLKPVDNKVLKKSKWPRPIVSKSVNVRTDFPKNLKPRFNKIGDRMESIMKDPSVIHESIMRKNSTTNLK